MTLARCPECLSPLTHSGVDLECGSCPRVYRVVAGVPRLLLADQLTGLNRRFRRIYDGMSPVYDRMEPLFARAFGGKDEARGEVLATLEFTEGCAVLDVGCGTGTMFEHYPLPLDQMTVHGVDLSWGQIVRARRKANRRGWPVELTQASAEQLPYADETFDVVYHMGGINFFSSPSRAINEMLRVARPGATLSIVDEAPRVVGPTRVFSRIGLEGVDRAVLRVMWSGPEGERAFLDRDDRDPASWAPDGTTDVALDTVWNGLGFRLSFRKG
jgi:ubiquinone/menaquinone biosynthesis C-methylase UbiE